MSYEINKKAQEVVAADFEIKDSFRYLMDITGLEQNFSNEKLQEFRAVSSLLTETLQQLAELRNLRENKIRPKKTEQTTNFVKFTNDIKPIPLPQITPEPEPVKVQEPKLKIYKDGGLGTMDRPTQITIDAYRDLKWFNK